MRSVVIFAVMCFVGLSAGKIRGQADLVLLNADVRTMAAKMPRAEAFAVINGKISAIGTTQQIRKLASERTVMIDAEGRVVIPGFNDAHVHFMPLGNRFSTIDVSKYPDAASLAKQLREYDAVLPKGRWLRGSGWDADKIAARTILGSVGERPLFIYATDARSALVSTAALKIAGISKADGVVSGAAMELVRRRIPADHSQNFAELAETASNFAASKGVTSIHDTNADDHRNVYRELERRGMLKTRIYDCVGLGEWRTAIDRKDTDMVRGGCVKDFWESDEERIDQLRVDIGAADNAGVQVLIHAIGGQANAVVLGIFEDVIKSNGRSEKRRFRIEHAHGVREEDVGRFVHSDVIASVQPHLFSTSYNGFFSKNVKVAFGSDAAMTELDPLLGIHAAVNFNGGISIDQAVRAYTAGSAYAEFQEEKKGSLDVGKFADFVILSKDIYSIDKASIKDTKILLTAVGGRVVYKDPELK